MRFGEVLDAGLGAHQMMHLELGHPADSAAEGQPDHHRRVITRDVRVTLKFVVPHVRSNPPVEDEHSARTDMVRQALDRRRQLGRIRYVPDAAEEAGDRIELAPKVQASHVSKVERHTRQSLACNIKHRWADVGAFDLVRLLELR